MVALRWIVGLGTLKLRVGFTSSFSALHRDLHKIILFENTSNGRHTPHHSLQPQSSRKLYKALKCRAKKAYGNDVYTMRDVELLRMSWFVTHSKSFIEMIPKIL